MAEYWQRQTAQKPLFPDILWSRPENKQGAGKLAIIGGNAHAFSAPGIAYNVATSAGAGVIQVVLPDAIKKTVKIMLPEADFAPSNPSGSFSKQAAANLYDIAAWSDCVLLAGDLGRNSETATLLEAFSSQYRGPLVITQDAVDYFKETPRMVLQRPQTALVLTLSQLQRVFINVPLIMPITFSMTLAQLVDALHHVTTMFAKSTIIVKHNDTLLCATAGQVTTTPDSETVWRVNTAARGSVFFMQLPTKPLEAFTTSFLEPVSS